MAPFVASGTVRDALQAGPSLFATGTVVSVVSKASPWAAAVFCGIIFGFVHVIGPDHLGTLMTLSTVMSEWKAFRVGAAWGLGHSGGMIAVALLFVGLQRLLPTISVQSWEYWGNHIVGASMIACGLYFLAFESSFLEKAADGSYSPASCACHGSPSPTMLHRTSRSRRVQLGTAGWRMEGGFGSPSPSPSPTSSSEWMEEENVEMKYPEIEEEIPLLIATACHKLQTAASAQRGTSALPFFERYEEPSQSSMARDLRGAALGLLQGLCCPMGTVGVTYLANLSLGVIGAFLITFIAVSSLGMGLLALGWGFFTRAGIGSHVKHNLVYRGSCAFTVALGVLWMLLNFCGALRALDYTESLQQQALLF